MIREQAKEKKPLDKMTMEELWDRFFEELAKRGVKFDKT